MLVEITGPVWKFVMMSKSRWNNTTVCELTIDSIFKYFVHPYSSINTVTAWQKSRFISLDRQDFHKINNFSISVYAFARCLLTSLSVDEMMLFRYENLSSRSRGLLLWVEIFLSRLKHMYSFYLCSRGDQCHLLFALDYAGGALHMDVLVVTRCSLLGAMNDR